MAHADPLSLPQAREKLERYLDALQALTPSARKMIDDLLVAASSPPQKDWTPPDPSKVDESINLTQCTDAKVWAEQFVARFGGDEGLMLSYFANAIMAGWDEATRRAASSPQREIETLKKEVYRLDKLLTCPSYGSRSHHCHRCDKELVNTPPSSDTSEHTCHDMNPPHPYPCRACELEASRG